MSFEPFDFEPGMKDECSINTSHPRQYPYNGGMHKTKVILDHSRRSIVFAFDVPFYKVFSITVGRIFLLIVATTLNVVYASFLKNRSWS